MYEVIEWGIILLYCTLSRIRRQSKAFRWTEPCTIASHSRNQWNGGVFYWQNSSWEQLHPTAGQVKDTSHLWTQNHPGFWCMRLDSSSLSTTRHIKPQQYAIGYIMNIGLYATLSLMGTRRYNWGAWKLYKPPNPSQNLHINPDLFSTMPLPHCRCSDLNRLWQRISQV